MHSILKCLHTQKLFTFSSVPLPEPRVGPIIQARKAMQADGLGDYASLPRALGEREFVFYLSRDSTFQSFLPSYDAGEDQVKQGGSRITGLETTLTPKKVYGKRHKVLLSTKVKLSFISISPNVSLYNVILHVEQISP